MLTHSHKTATLSPSSSRPLLSVVVPCFNEALNLPLLYERVREVLERQGVDWELIAVDDHSIDGTFDVAGSLAARDGRVRAIRLARNVGSHLALMCGLRHARGHAAVMIAADMQDPPEIILALLERWREGDQVVWAIRAARKGLSATEEVFSRIFHKIMTRIIGRGDLGGHGADVFLVDRVAIDALSQCHEGNLSLFSLLAWLGFRQSTVPYVKDERQHGRSGWTFRKKLKLLIDSIAAFSYVPIRIMSLVGIGVACLGFLYALFVIVSASLIGRQVEGWSSLMVVVLVIGGLQMTMLGVLGEYLWRTLDEARHRPRYNVEQSVGSLQKDEEISQSNLKVENFDEPRIHEMLRR
jgi:polyisoprenyl-phosphate glycosyltransferase